MALGHGFVLRRPAQRCEAGHIILLGNAQQVFDGAVVHIGDPAGAQSISVGGQKQVIGSYTGILHHPA